MVLWAAYGKMNRGMAGFTCVKVNRAMIAVYCDSVSPKRVLRPKGRKKSIAGTLYYHNEYIDIYPTFSPAEEY